MAEDSASFSGIDIAADDSDTDWLDLASDSHLPKPRGKAKKKVRAMIGFQICGPLDNVEKRMCICVYLDPGLCRQKCVYIYIYMSHAINPPYKEFM